MTTRAALSVKTLFQFFTLVFDVYRPAKFFKFNAAIVFKIVRHCEQYNNSEKS